MSYFRVKIFSKTKWYCGTKVVEGVRIKAFTGEDHAMQFKTEQEAVDELAWWLAAETYWTYTWQIERVGGIRDPFAVTVVKRGTRLSDDELATTDKKETAE